MHHFVVLRLDLADIDTPLRRRGLFQHPPRSRAALPHRLDEMAQAARAVGVLVAVFLLVAGRLLDMDAGPVGLELVGHHHRQAGARAGAHLGAMIDDGHDAAGVDRDKDMRIGDHPAGKLGGAGGVGEGSPRRQEFGGEDEAAGGQHAAQKAAAADVFDRDVNGGHVTLLSQPP